MYTESRGELNTPPQDDIRAKRAIKVYWTLGGALLGIAALLFLLTIPVARTREAAPRSQSKNNLKQIGLAFHNYHDDFTAFPDEACGESWTTQLLPYLDQAPLYHALDYGKPFDDPANNDSTKKRFRF